MISAEETSLRLRRSRQLASLLDGAWGIPFTRWRIGVDPLLGLFPVAGDLLSALLGLGIVWQARRLAAPQWLQVKMLGNIALDFVIGSIPVIGDIADIGFRQNTRNATLLENWVKSREVKSSAAQ